MSFLSVVLKLYQICQDDQKSKRSKRWRQQRETLPLPCRVEDEDEDRLRRASCEYPSVFELVVQEAWPLSSSRCSSFFLDPFDPFPVHPSPLFLDAFVESAFCIFHIFFSSFFLPHFTSPPLHSRHKNQQSTMPDSPTKGPRILANLSLSTSGHRNTRYGRACLFFSWRKRKGLYLLWHGCHMMLDVFRFFFFLSSKTSLFSLNTTLTRRCILRRDSRTIYSVFGFTCFPSCLQSASFKFIWFLFLYSLLYSFFTM